jgi:hypothetical protein
VQEDSPAAWRRVDLKTTLTYSMSAPLRRYPIFPGFSALSTAGVVTDPEVRRAVVIGEQ